MITYLFEVSLCWAVFYLLYILFLSRETFFHLNRSYLLGTLVLGLCMPLVDLSALFAQSNPVVPTSVYYLETITVSVQNFEQSIEAVIVSPIAESLSVFDVLLWVYWVGFIFMLIRFLIGFSQIAKLYFNSEKQNKGTYTLILTSGKHLPFSFFHLFFKSKNFSLSSTDQEKITQHELAHIKGWHSIDVLLLELASILLWCSPLIHLYKQSLRNIHEYVADANVLRNTSKKHYGQLLLQLFQKSPGMALANNFIHSQLKKRIKMMTKTQSSKRAYWKYLTALPLIGILAFVLTKSDLVAQANSNEIITTEIEERTHPVLKEKQEESTDPIFTVVEEMPRFPGCESIEGDQKAKKDCSNKKLIEFIVQNIKYPESAKKNNVEGIVVIKFVVDKEGNAINPEIIRSLHAECDAEALRVVKMMPTWTPGKQRGKNVSVYFHLPVRYKLTDEEKTLKTESNVPAPPAPEACEMFGPVEEMPRFPGCEDEINKAERKKCSDAALLDFIYTNLEYPVKAKKAGVEGLVVVSFTVSKEGDILNPEIKRSIGHGCDESVLNLMEQMNEMEEKWIPGKQRGKKVDVQFHLPVRFKVGDTATPKAETKAPSIDNNSLDVKYMKIFPNPISDGQINKDFESQVTIDFELNTKAANLKLRAVDINGKVITTVEDFGFGVMNKNIVHLDMSKAAVGPISISLIDGDKIYTKTLMKQ